MADRKIELGELGLVDYLIGAGLVVMCIAILSSVVMFAGLSVPDFLPSVVGAALGVAVWFSYLLKRKADHAR